MNWRVKATAQMVASSVPFGAGLNYAGQRLVMGRFATLERPVADRLAKARWLLEALRRAGPAAISPALFEIGSGWHLGVPLSLWCLGVERQVTADVRRLARLELVNKAIAALRDIPEDLPRRPVSFVRSLAELKSRYGIDYRAPFDARRTGFPDESVDAVHSTLTLQHVPVPVLKRVLAEAHRILMPSGTLLSILDYGDNYAYTDRSITVYNFLQYSGRKWRWFNPPLHYQNRLRHVQYLELFAACGFCVVEAEIKAGSVGDIETVRRLRLAPEFAGYPPAELAVRSARIAAVKGGRP